MKRLLVLLPLLLLPLLVQGAVNTNIINASYDRSNGRFVLPTNASFGGNVGFGTTNLSNGRIVVGPTETLGTTLHAFRDETSVILTNAISGNNAYASFDVQFNASGTGVYNHLAAFQARPEYSGSGGINTRFDVFVSSPVHSGSKSIANLRGLHITDTIGGGPIQNQYGIEIDPLTAGTNNFAIRTSTGQVQFGDAVGCLSTLQTVGNVGIKKAPTAVALDIAGDIEIAGTFPYIAMKPSGWASGSYVGAGLNLEASNVGDFTAFYGPAIKGYVFRSGASNLLMIATNGNVGIGMTVDLPTHLLELEKSSSDGASVNFPTAKISNTLGTKGNGTNTWNIAEFKTSAGTGAVIGGIWSSYDDINTAWNAGSATLSPVNIVVGDIPKVTVDIAGKVGIGTTMPYSKLDVYDLDRVITDFGNLGIMTTNSVAIDKGGFITLGGVYTGTSTSPFGGIVGRKENATDNNYSGYLGFTTIANGGNMTERMRITSTGNVGLGTNAPQAKLHVVGDAIISGGINSRTNIGALDVTTNIFVLGTRYTNSNRRLFVSASIALTAAAAGTATVALYVENLGTATNSVAVSAGPLASLVTTEPLFLPVGPGMIYYFADETSGVGASATILGNRCSLTAW